jgi:tRNA threonylcarbamoyl adenosine modification protein YeaZ
MIVAIESASTDLSIALADREGSLRRVDGWSAGQRQAHDLLPRIVAALEAEGGSLADVSALAVGTGPGSFTGLRVGMSVAKGLAFALSRPIVGVPSLQSWLTAEPAAGGALARAGARDAYLLMRGDHEPRIIDREELAALATTLVAPAELVTAFGLADTVQPLRAAGAIAAAAAQRLRSEPGGDDLEHLEPAYLRAPRGNAPTSVGERR